MQATDSSESPLTSISMNVSVQKENDVEENLQHHQQLLLQQEHQQQLLLHQQQEHQCLMDATIPNNTQNSSAQIATHDVIGK